MTERFTIRKSYQLSAIKIDGTRVWYDTDSYSGGYPYWSSSHNNVTFDSLDIVPVIKPSDYMQHNVSRMEVIEVEIVGRVVDSTEMVSAVRAKAMAEIESIQGELQKKLALLEGIK